MRRTNVGAALRRARRARGLELADVEHALRIREQHLRALETNRFDDIDGTAYARLFLREYAEYLGLDGDRILTLVGDRLESHETFELETDDATTDQPTEIEPTRLLVWLDHALGHVPPGVRRWAWLAVVLVPILVLVLRAGGGSHHATLEPPAPTRTPTVASTPPDSRLIAAPATISAATRIPSSRPMSVELSAPRGDCWILVRDGNSQGPVMFEGVVRRGGTVGFQGRTLWLRVGAPWNLVVRVDGRVTRGLPARPSDLLVTPQGAKTTA